MQRFRVFRAESFAHIGLSLIHIVVGVMEHEFLQQMSSHCALIFLFNPAPKLHFWSQSLQVKLHPPEGEYITSWGQRRTCLHSCAGAGSLIFTHLMFLSLSLCPLLSFSLAPSSHSLSFSLLRSVSHSSILVFQSDRRCSQQPSLINIQSSLLRGFAPFFSERYKEIRSSY